MSGKSLDRVIYSLPENPGVYKFLSENDTLIYVGKAKNIKKRVRSYFTKQTSHNRKTKKLVSEIAQIESIVAPTEYDALLLENSLIKENQPKYNILLKDDKSFPNICIVDERFPRILSARNKPYKGEYFGPYTSVSAMKSVLDLIQKLYHLRTCKYNLSKENIEASKFKVCLEYHIGNCKGPCEGLQDELEYMEEIKLAREILKGKLSVVKDYFRNKMDENAVNLKFEQAHHYKEKLELLEKFHVKSTVVNPSLSNIDVVTVVGDDKNAFVNYMQIQNGSIILSDSRQVKKKMGEDDGDILQSMTYILREEYSSNNPLILTNHELFLIPENSSNSVPSIGDKKKLIDMSIRNALEFKKEKILLAKPKRNKTLAQLQTDLRLTEYPDHIECFDNSNLGGSNPVASMVCFKNGKPSRSNYRKFNIKTVVGPDDFASMKEVVGRRYKRVQEEGEDMPKLIVIDGGKGQLSSAVSALNELGLYGEVPVIGIAKRLEEIYFPGDSIPVHINKKSPSLNLIQHLRDEAHRFAINFHRQKRSKGTIKTELSEIEGIGPGITKKLLSTYKSIKKIKEAELTDLQETIGKSKGSIVYAYFRNKKTPDK